MMRRFVKISVGNVLSLFPSLSVFFLRNLRDREGW
jgi:hypothetical protein